MAVMSTALCVERSTTRSIQGIDHTGGRSLTPHPLTDLSFRGWDEVTSRSWRRRGRQGSY